MIGNNEEHNKLAIRAQNGNEYALEQILEITRQLANEWGLIKFKDFKAPMDREDMSQDIVEKVYKQIKKKNIKAGDKYQFNAYVRTITTNHYIDKLRKNWYGKEKNSTYFKSSIDDHLTVSINYSPKEKRTTYNISEQFLHEDLSLALDKITNENHRTTFELIIIQGYQYQEVADELGINLGTVKSNISKARKILKEQLSSYKSA